jgi:ketol-acid reductoisomerase
MVVRADLTYSQGINRMWSQMSNTAHTREIADLRNAGLNPILSSKNAGAPTGAGAMIKNGQS